MKTTTKVHFLTAVLLMILISSAVYAQNGWVRQQVNTQAAIKKIIVIDSLNYIALPDTIGIFRTTNGGESWTRQIIAGEYEYNNGKFINSMTGYLLSDFNMCKTTDGGVTWIPVPVPNNLYKGIDFINAATGFISGTDTFLDSPVAIVLKTTNGGINWSTAFQIDLGASSTVKFYSADSGHAWVINRLHYTTNGGANWTRHSLAPSSYDVAASLDFNTAISVGSAGFLHKTTNRGFNWNALSYNTSSITRSIGFIDILTGYIAGDNGLISRTTNSGENWITQNSGVSSGLNNIVFYNSLTGFASGAGGVILKTTTAGLTFVNTLSIQVPDKYSLYQNYPNPFNPETNIRFDLQQPSNVKIVIYNSLGRQMQVLADEHKPAGSYEVKFNAEGYAGGVYFYTITAGEFRETRKMLLLK